MDGSALAPFGESQPATVILKNADYTIIFTTFFKVLGRPAPGPAKSPDFMQALIDLLVRKGVFTKEDGASSRRPAPSPAPLP